MQYCRELRRPTLYRTWELRLIESGRMIGRFLLRKWHLRVPVNVAADAFSAMVVAARGQGRLRCETINGITGLWPHPLEIPAEERAVSGPEMSPRRRSLPE